MSRSESNCTCWNFGKGSLIFCSAYAFPREGCADDMVIRRSIQIYVYLNPVSILDIAPPGSGWIWYWPSKIRAFCLLYSTLTKYRISPRAPKRDAWNPCNPSRSLSLLYPINSENLRFVECNRWMQCNDMHAMSKSTTLCMDRTRCFWRMCPTCSAWSCRWKGNQRLWGGRRRWSEDPKYFRKTFNRITTLWKRKVRRLNAWYFVFLSSGFYSPKSKEEREQKRNNQQ